MDIVSVLNQLHVPVAVQTHRHARLNWANIDCIFCHSGPNKFHLGINLEYGFANCWRCGRHSLYDIFLALTHDHQTVRAILDDLRLQRPTAARRPTTGRLVRPHGVGPLGRPHIAYLRRRGLNPDTCTRLWGAAGIGLAARLKWRIYLPVIHHGREVSWTTRALSRTTDRRYISASPSEEEVPIKSVLYGADYCRGAVVVHEGPMDVWRTGPGSVALFGLNYTRAQLVELARYPLRVICLDNEDRAQAVAGKLARELSVFPGRTVQVQLESGKDAGSADEEELEEIRKSFLQ